MGSVALAGCHVIERPPCTRGTSGRPDGARGSQPAGRLLFLSFRNAFYRALALPRRENARALIAQFRRPRRAGLPTRRVAEPDLRRCSQHNCSYFPVLDRLSVPVHIPSDVE